MGNGKLMKGQSLKNYLLFTELKTLNSKTL